MILILYKLLLFAAKCARSALLQENSSLEEEGFKGETLCPPMYNKRNETPPYPPKGVRPPAWWIL